MTEKQAQDLKDMVLIKKYYKQLINNEVRLFEFGVNDCRFDLISVNPFKKTIRGFEIKITRADFLKDKREEKWKKYLDYCDTFYWICRPDVIKREDVDGPAGLMWIYTYAERYPQYANLGDHYETLPISRLVKRADKNKVDCDARLYVLALLLQRAKHRGEEFF